MTNRQNRKSSGSIWSSAHLVRTNDEPQISVTASRASVATRPCA